jgi:hypothetical protein
MIVHGRTSSGGNVPLLVDSEGRLIVNAPRILAQSAVAVSGAADTAENTLATITVPANAMGPNGTLRIWTSWSYTNSANGKTLRVRFSGASGTQFMNPTVTASVVTSQITQITNRNATNSQVSASGANASGIVVGSGTALATSAVDTTVETTIVITGQKALGTETLTLERYLVELIYGA